jgi:hypothetical protein
MRHSLDRRDAAASTIHDLQRIKIQKFAVIGLTGTGDPAQIWLSLVSRKLLLSSGNSTSDATFL